MRRWYFFFVLVGILVALGGLGVFSGSLEQQTDGQAGPGKVLFLAMLAFGGLSYAAWLAYSSSARKRRSDAHKDAVDRGTPETAAQPDGGVDRPDPSAPEAPWQPPRRDAGDRPRNDPTR